MNHEQGKQVTITSVGGPVPLFPPIPHCPKCGCGIVFEQQKSLDERCADCFRLDRLDGIMNKMTQALDRLNGKLPQKECLALHTSGARCVLDYNHVGMHRAPATAYSSHQWM